ncbi:hypothetical protein PAPHI01_2105 [Pancytospora philotis]|nr:hypothetical protein PAPHI01_2105 [Pancytospora philotis]
MKTLTKVAVSAVLSSLLMHYFIGTSYFYPVFFHFVFYAAFMLLMTISNALQMKFAPKETIEAYTKKLSDFSGASDSADAGAKGEQGESSETISLDASNAEVEEN